MVGACVLGLLSAGAFLCWIELHQPVPTPAWVSQLLPWGILTSLLIVTAPMNIFLFQGLAVMSRANLQEDGR